MSSSSRPAGADAPPKSCCVASRSGTAVLTESKHPRGRAVEQGSRHNAIGISGGTIFIGTDRPVIPFDGEGPRRSVTLKDYLLEAQAVTNARFAEFVAATGYVTEAERFGWSAVFVGLLGSDRAVVPRAADTPWWGRVDGASWRNPEGPGSSIDDRWDHPVTQVSWADAKSFAEWVGGRLPSEAEWEHAAGSGDGRRFPWGDAEPDDERIFCNIWQGRFPRTNTCRDGYVGTAPAISFEPSGRGFYNLCGNVWEWTADAFHIRSLSRAARERNERAREFAEKVVKGGSFLCHISYCYRYRIAARMSLIPDSAASNVGFRVAYHA